jgi:hypothetical protein
VDGKFGVLIPDMYSAHHIAFLQKLVMYVLGYRLGAPRLSSLFERPDTHHTANIILGQAMAGTRRKLGWTSRLWSYPSHSAAIITWHETRQSCDREYTVRSY